MMDYLKKILGIVVENEVVEKMEEKEVEEKKLTPQQLRKKYFLKRMKREDKWK
jgi:hypothetical protein